MPHTHTTLYPTAPIMLVDDEPRTLDGLEILLRNEGMTNVLKVTDPRRVMPLLKAGPVCVVLLDLTMPHLSGETILADIAMEYPQVPVIIITGNHHIETAVSCMKNGAFDFLVKPLDIERVVTCLRHAIGQAELRDENRQLRDRILATGTLEHPEYFNDIITANPAMLAIFQYIEAIAESAHPVLIAGETGVGKELAARAVHTASRRAGQFVAVNVAGLDDQMFTDTLFGHVRGAYTGAQAGRAGLIALAADGTLFLDEIGDLSQPSQLKLLRLLQESEYRPMGADAIQHTNARIIVATNRNLNGLQAEGQFRKDLYYRLATHEINIPPLRRRPEDIPLLIRHFRATCQKHTGKKLDELPDDVAQLLAAYEFPGNVRELKSILFDLAHQHPRNDGDTAKLLRQKLSPPPNAAPMHLGIPGGAPADELPTLKTMTERLIQEAMRRAGGRQTVAARLLGISQQALCKRLRRPHPEN